MYPINLLSPEEKNSVKKYKLFFILKNVTFRFISLILIIATIFIFSYFLLNNEKKSLDELINGELSLQAEGKVSAVEDATSDLNRQLILANNIQLKYIKWSNLIKSFSSNISDGIILNNLEFDTTNKKLNIKGVAKNREQLVDFQNNLEELSYLNDIKIPISNLLQREDINFEITGELTDTIYEKDYSN